MKSYLPFIIILLILFGSLAVQAQTTKEQRLERRETRRAKKDSLQSLPIHSYFTLDLLKPIPTQVPRINMGYIHSLNERWSVGSSIGYGNDSFIYSYKDDYSLFEIRPQVLYNLGKGKRFQHFLSLEAFYITHKETLFNSDLTPVNDLNGAIETIAFDSADFTRLKYGFTINYGEYMNLSKRLGLRTLVGGGIRFKDNVYSNLRNPRAVESDRFLIGSLYQKEGFRIGFELNLSFELMYKL